ncbi:MAG: zeta toxin family protein [Campylobacterales bacterium]|nr:zeta toxin family protein [Campylobacterales bacterium]
MRLSIVAGANGSGKTTFALSYATFHSIAFVNADEIAKSLNPDHMEQEKFRAGKIFLEQIEELLNNRQELIIETTMSGKYLIKIIQKAKEIGYQIDIFYLYLAGVKDHIARVQNRVFNGGHSIPREDIIRRYYRSRQLFFGLYKELADRWFLFFNADDEFEEVANFADGELTVLHEPYYHMFTKGLI